MTDLMISGERVIQNKEYLAAIPGVVKNLRATYAKGITKDKNWRMNQLKALQKLFTENQDALCQAMLKDMNRDSFSTFIGELAGTEIEIQYAITHLNDWIKSKSLKIGIANQPGHAEIVPEPLGVVLIMAAWNFPFLTLFQPAIGAIAAGNCVVLKPASLTGHSSILIAELVSKYMDPSAITVVEGGAESGSILLEQKFDKIMYTGGCGVAKIVAAAAAKNLTPVDLELGGKNPCIVTSSMSDMHVAARRMAWSKFAVNAGQICISPDYLMVHESIGDQFVQLIEKNIAGFFENDPAKSEYNTRIINESNTKRLGKILDLDKAFITLGGTSDVSKKYIAPTILNFKSNIDAFINSQAMREEIFGPILPVVYFKDLDWCISLINQRDKPLSLSFYGSSSDAKRVITTTSSGSVTVNDCLMQKSEPDIPFGGVGASGSGRYNGKYTFEAFSHMKPVLERPLKSDVAARYPPYTQAKRDLFNHLHQYLLGHKSFLSLGLKMARFHMSKH